MLAGHAVGGVCLFAVMKKCMLRLILQTIIDKIWLSSRRDCYARIMLSVYLANMKWDLCDGYE